MVKLENAKGTRDFNPEDMMLRQRIFNIIKEKCELFSFNPIETPIIEKYETLSAKFAAGEESDALTEIFKTSDNGNRNLGLRFDLTVPFSRYIAMNRDIKMPFRKYMYGEVFRDGPIKKGRYRQFTQFDADIVGCNGMLADAEILALADAVFKELGLKFSIDLNNRKIIDGVLTDIGIKENDFESFTISIDKLKKIGKKGVLKELTEKGFKKEGAENALNFLSKKKDNGATLNALKKSVKSEIGLEGIQEMQLLLSYLSVMGINSVVFDPSLARGLAYYTGPVFEAFLINSDITSSAAGGGRYDELIGNYIGSKEKIPATGISFGVEVLVEAFKGMKQTESKGISDIYIIPIKPEETLDKSLEIAQELRKNGIKVDIDLNGRGISKNLTYASSYNIPYALFCGTNELTCGKLKLRDMKTGKEVEYSVDKLISFFKK